VTIGPNPVTGMHVFVFIDHSDTQIPAVIKNLAGLRSASPRVHWAGSVIGDYLALAHVIHDDPNDLDGMQTFIETTLWNAGVHCKKATEVAVVNMKGTKIGTPEILALVGIKTEHGRAMSVMEQLESIDDEQDRTWLQGASLVTGHLDILLQLNADTLEAAHQRLLDPALANIEGIAWTSTAISDGTRGPFAPES